MKRIMAMICAAVILLLSACTGTDVTGETTGPAEQTSEQTSEQTTNAAGESVDTETDAAEPQLPDHYIDFSDEENIYACSALYNVSTEYTGDGMKVNFLQSGNKPGYCFDPYMTLPLPDGRIDIEEYPFFVISLYTSKSDLQGDIRYKTDGLKSGDSYPTYRFSYGGTGDRVIVLDLRKMSQILFVANGDSPTKGHYTNLRMDMFENDCSTDDVFVIYWYAFFKTKKEAQAFTGMPRAQKDDEKLPDLSAYYKGAEFVAPDAAYKPKKLLYGFDGAYDFTVRKLVSNGYGGLVTNVKLDMNYLKDEGEFALLKTAYIRAKEAGLHLWIYDEYQWPSGKAFGQVLEGHDEYEATGIEWIKLTGNGDINYTLPDNYIGIVGADLIDGGARTPLQTDGRTLHAKHDGQYTVYVYARRITNQGREDPTDFATLRDVDLLNKDAVARFIETTYKKYKDEFGDAFGSVEAFFTDEPQLGNRDMKNYVVWTDKLPGKFREMHGYDIESELYSLYDGNTDHDKTVRVNFYQTVAAMFRESYFEQIAEWCEKNGTASSGHLLFEENIQRHIETYGGDFMQLCGAMTIPGGDILNVEPDRLLAEGNDIGNYVGLKYVSSAAKNAGKLKVHLEFTPSAVTGAPFFSEPGKYTTAGATLASFFGANTYSVICGDSDIPAKDLQTFTTYVGRINALLDTAVTTSQIGVFYPVDTVRAAYTATGDHFDYTGNDGAAMTNRRFQHVCCEMLTAGFDYTVLDDQSVSQSSIDDGKMKIGLGEYSVIVMPRVEVLSLQAAEKLLKFKEAGGVIIWTDIQPSLCSDQRDQGKFETVMKSLKANITGADIGKELSQYCEIPMNAILKSGVFITEYERTDDGKRIVYLANSTKYSKTVNLGEGCGKYYIYDPYACTVTEAEGAASVRIAAYRALLIVE